MRQRKANRILEGTSGNCQGRWKLALAASAALAVAAPAFATSINFGGRTWTTNDTDPDNPPSYSAGGSTGLMTGQWAQDAAISTGLTLNVGDVISYDSKLLTTGGWFSDTGFGFIDNTGLYDSAH